MNEHQIRTYVITRLMELGHLDRARANCLSSTEDDLLLQDLQLDSLSILDLSMALEDATGRIVEPADLIQAGSLNALAAWLASKAA
jgi:acyl carrier protein